MVLPREGGFGTGSRAWRPLQARARNAANTGTAYNNVGSSASPLNLLKYSAPISNDAVSRGSASSVNANDALRTGTYQQGADVHPVHDSAVITVPGRRREPAPGNVAASRAAMPGGHSA